MEDLENKEVLDSGSGPEPNGPTLEEVNAKIDKILDDKDDFDFKTLIDKQQKAIEKLLSENEKLKDANLKLASTKSAPEHTMSVEEILSKNFVKE